MSEHSPLGPSGAERWLACPGSVRLSEGLPDTESVYAAEGTFAHDISERARRENKPAKAYIGEASECGRFKVDKAFADAIQVFLDYVAEFPGEGLYEQRVEYDAWVPNGFGTADDIRVSEGMCYITDLKFGSGVKIMAADNPQLWLYALGVFQDFGHLYDIDCFQLNISQPRIDHVDESTVPAKDILLWARDQVEPAAELTKDPEAPFLAGTHCRWCRAREICTARKDWVLAQMMDEMDDLETRKDPDLMDNEQLAQAMAVVDVIRSWCGDIESRALAEIQAGRSVGDWKLVAGRSVRKWKSEKKAEAALRKTKLKVGQILVAKLISPAQAEKLIGKGHEIMTKQVSKPPGAPKLAPGTDPRPSVVADISELD